MDEAPPNFELRNAGVGPDPLLLEATASAVDFAVLLLLRDYHCPKCKAQVQRVAEKAEQLKRRDTAVGAVLPDSYEKAADWQERYDLPFPLLADPAGEVVHSYEGESLGDRPSIESLLEVVDDLRDSFVFDCELVEC